MFFFVGAQRSLWRRWRIAKMYFVFTVFGFLRCRWGDQKKYAHPKVCVFLCYGGLTAITVEPIEFDFSRFCSIMETLIWNNLYNLFRCSNFSCPTRNSLNSTTLLYFIPSIIIAVMCFELIC